MQAPLSVMFESYFIVIWNKSKTLTIILHSFSCYQKKKKEKKLAVKSQIVKQRPLMMILG